MGGLIQKMRSQVKGLRKRLHLDFAVAVFISCRDEISAHGTQPAFDLPELRKGEERN